MPKMEEYKRPSDSDITFMVDGLRDDLDNSIDAGRPNDYSDWEQDFIKSMYNRLKEGTGFTEPMEQKIKEVWEKYLNTDGC